MPYDAEVPQADVKGIVANAIDVVVETGDSGPVTPVGINLPNDQRIREQYGSKSVSLSNVVEAYDKSTPGTMRGEFSWTPEEAERGDEVRRARRRAAHRHARGDRPRVRAAGGRLQGHAAAGASRSTSPRSRKGARIWSGSTSSRTRSWWSSASFPPRTRTTIVRAEYEGYTRNALVQLRRVREGTQIDEDHMRNRQMIIRWLMANTKAIEQRTRDGKTYLAMVDPKAFREGVGPAARRGAADQVGRRLRRRRRSCSTPTASTSIRSCATRSSRAWTS